MDDRSKHIDKDAVEEQGITPDGKNDPGAIPAPHSLPVSQEFEEVAEQQSDEAGTAQDIDDNVTGQTKPGEKANDASNA